MTEKRIAHTGYDQEDAYFHQKDGELLAKRQAGHSMRSAEIATSARSRGCGAGRT